MTARLKARRVTIYKDRNGEWRYRVQAGNWKTIEASEEGFKRRHSILRRIEQQWPEAEVLDET